jgi:SAM-dependent methyltransferase
MPLLVSAGHERKLEILDALDVGDLTGSIVVDFGVGSWGFAGIFPRVHDCALAIGIDISEAAIRESARVSAAGTFPYADRWAYLTSTGDRIELHDESVDLVFAGEVIEHVDHTDVFLDELHRILRPGGELVITTPNADAPLYRARGEEWCVGPEHIALMGWTELERRLRPRFDLIAATGFNMAFHHDFDGEVHDPELAERWARLPDRRPELANGVVVHVRRRNDWRPPKHQIRHLDHDDRALRWKGQWRDVPLHEVLSGRLGNVGARLDFEFDGTDLIVQFWAHPWSGIAELQVGDRIERVDLYSASGGFRRVCVEGLVDRRHQVTIRPTGARRHTAFGSEVIVHHVLTDRALTPASRAR